MYSSMFPSFITLTLPLCQRPVNYVYQIQVYVFSNEYNYTKLELHL